VRSVAWSPDGQQIAFTADTRGDEQTQVYVMSAGGGDPMRLSAADDRQYVLAEKTPFDPTGRYLLCGGNDRDRSVPDLVVYDLSGGPSTRLCGREGGNLFPLAFSPLGRRVLADVIASNTDCQCAVGALDNPQQLEFVGGQMSAEYGYPGRGAVIPAVSTSIPRHSGIASVLPTSRWQTAR
jgi:hypothetical protein